MAEQTAGQSGTTRVAGSWARFKRHLHRAHQYPGPERAMLLFILKGTVAATIAWLIAEYVLKSQSPAFAPFAAVVMVQITISESFLRSLRFALAASVGVCLEGLLGFWLNPHVWTFAVVAFLALVLGQWRRLGPQGHLVPTSAFFAYSVFVMPTAAGDRFMLLGQLVVLLGCAVGIAVNVALLPPLRLRDARYALDNMVYTLRDLLGDISAVLRERAPDPGETQDFWQRGRRLEALSNQARDTIYEAETSLRWNPRRLLLRRLPPIIAYDALVHHMARIGEGMRSVTDIMRRLPDRPGSGEQRMLGRYGDVLQEVRCAVEQLADLDPEELDSVRERFRDHLDRARSQHEEPLPDGDSGAHDGNGERLLYGGLLLEAERMLNELEAAYDALRV
ncbi:hypothetical protein FZ103_11365 [Streptomonospora sp. PA3]|uniref:FUSC family protein n=1 Tax=Streptomonospora sp. PA3 TaxID=2607326 RepID=UPI0012DC2691|nr:FUSC family protein [Streptomonospora sp. PA3]MUL41766.1 hypothetical protein [Streptomonospora sp. PA3]